MKKILVFASAFLLAGCVPGLAAGVANIGSAPTTVSTVGDKVVVQGSRGLILAHNAVQGAIAIVNPLVRARVLTAAQVNQYEALLGRVEYYRTGATAGLTIAQRTTGLFNIANELNALAGR